MNQNTNQPVLLREQCSTTRKSHGHRIESIEEYVSRGGKIRTMKSCMKTLSKKSYGPILLVSLHHRFPNPESLAMANERRKLRAEENRG